MQANTYFTISSQITEENNHRKSGRDKPFTLEHVEQGARLSSYLLDEKYSRDQLWTTKSLFSLFTVPGPPE